MNLKKTWKLAEVLMLSAVRARKGNSLFNKEAKAGLVNTKITAVGFPLLAVIIYVFVSRAGIPPELISGGLGQVFVFLPFLSLFLMILNGLMFEITMSKFSTSMDIVNWLPIRASEYVVGSTISSIYFSLPFLMLIYGITLGVAFYVGQTAIWIVTLVISLVSIFIGGFLIEVVRAFINEVSSSISNRGGKISQALQMVTTLIVIVAMTLLFNYNVLFKIMDWFGFTLEQAWFIPFTWPSMMIRSILLGSMYHTVMYCVGCLVLLGGSFILGTYAREKYWVPKPISIDFSPRKETRIRKSSSFGKSAEQVIFSKDLKALFRRKEMMSLLAIPLVLFILNFVQNDVTVLWDTSASYIARLSFFTYPGMGLFMMTLYLSMINIGQEGRGFINLQMSPVTPKQVILGKLPLAWFFSAVPLVLMLVFERIYINVPIDAFWGISVIGFVTITETSFVGLMFGTMYPDFTEVPRARFIRSEGSFVTMIGTGLTVLVSVAPVFLSHYVFGWLSFWWSGLISLLLMCLVCWISYRHAVFKMGELLQVHM